MRFKDYHYSFWIPTDASIPGRMALLITAYLILTNMATSQHGNMAFDAKVFSAMDAWFYACRFFVGAALLQFAMVIKLVSRLPSESDLEEHRQGTTSASKRCRIYDRFAFWIFSLTFVVFCFAYGAICCSQ